LLRTSGTTSRPKRVPLTHGQLCRSAANVAQTLHLVRGDRCLNLMPLFHVHGFVAALLASLHAGASVVCTGGFVSGCFTAWLRRFQPTWYTGVPALHQAVLREVADEHEPLRHGLRVVRSSSAALPRSVAEQLRRTFGVPVIEAYGMTEAAHQIASQTLSATGQCDGSVGRATGPAIAVIDDAGAIVAPFVRGEVVIRGDTVIAAYDEPPGVNESAFTDGWFRTGDQGFVDESGALHLTGRLKELINRGGEKVSPRAVEDALLEHEEIAECAAFGVPHPTLGEDVAAAVVTRAGAIVDCAALRESLFDRLSAAEIPSFIVEVDALPKTPTGKIARLQVAKSVPDRLVPPFVAPVNAIETSLAAMVAALLNVARVGATDNFFALGGDSLRGAQLLSRIRAEFGASLLPATLFKAATVRALAAAVAKAQSDAPPQLRARDPVAASGHTAVARSLRDLGVSTLYGVPGEPVYSTFGACAREGLRLIGTRHQQGAVLMAAAHNYVAGAPVAATAVSSGVAACNALAGAAVAHANAWPLVLLAGAAPLAPADFGHFTALDLAPLFRPVTKEAITVMRTADIANAMRDAFALARHGRPGPVLLQFPASTLEGTAPLAIARPSASPDTPRLDACLQSEAVRTLNAAARPLLILGKGARWNDAHADVHRLVDRLQIPFVTSPIARGYVPDDHPLCVNAVSGHAQREADVVLLLGARLDWTFRHGAEIAADAAIIQVDIDRDELGRNRTASVPIHADLREFACDFAARVTASDERAMLAARDPHWLASLCHRRAEAVRTRSLEAQATGSLITPAALARSLDDALPHDALTVFDGNLCLTHCQRHIVARQPVSRLTPGNSGYLGVGVPYAIGAKLARPDRPVVAVCGDFAFGLSAIELETAVRNRIPILVLVANNDGSAGALADRRMLDDDSPERVARFTPGLRYDELMRTFGGGSAHVTRLDELAAAVADGLAAEVPVCINVALDQHAAFTT
jgi:thiamine pyrophosphate-dependent acetolactate synthase large subunit-like protein/acyl carrier protein